MLPSLIQKGSLRWNGQVLVNNNPEYLKAVFITQIKKTRQLFLFLSSLRATSSFETTGLYFFPQEDLTFPSPTVIMLVSRRTFPKIRAMFTAFGVTQYLWIWTLNEYIFSAEQQELLHTVVGNVELYLTTLFCL